MEAVTGQSTESVASFRRAIALGEELVISHPEVALNRVDLALSHNNLGVILDRIGEPAASRRSDQQAITIWKDLVREHGDPEFRVGLGRSYCNLGWHFCVAGRLDEAIEALGKSVENIEVAIEGAVRDDGPTASYRNQLCAALDNLGVVYFYAGRRVEGEAIYLKALAVIKRLADENPAVTEFRAREIQIYDNLGHLLAHAGRDAEAQIAFETALKKATRLTGDQMESYSPAYSYRGLGRLLRKEGRAADAQAAFRKAIEINVSTPAEKPYSLYELACARALCGAMAGEGKAALTPAERETKKHYTDGAMKALIEAVAGGWENVAWMKLDPDLDELRSRADFRAMIRRLELEIEDRSNCHARHHDLAISKVMNRHQEFKEDWQRVTSSAGPESLDWDTAGCPDIASYQPDDALARGRAPKIVGLCPSDPRTPIPMGLTRLSVPMIAGPLILVAGVLMAVTIDWFRFGRVKAIWKEERLALKKL